MWPAIGINQEGKWKRHRLFATVNNSKTIWKSLHAQFELFYTHQKSSDFFMLCISDKIRTRALIFILVQGTSDNLVHMNIKGYYNNINFDKRNLNYCQFFFFFLGNKCNYYFLPGKKKNVTYFLSPFYSFLCKPSISFYLGSVNNLSVGTDLSFLLCPFQLYFHPNLFPLSTLSSSLSYYFVPASA